jgi:hypothetical protein
MASPRISSEEALAIVEKQRQERLESTKNFLTGFAKNFTTDLPGFLMDVADKFAGDTATLGEKDRSAQLFEAMTGIKTKSGSGGVDELLGGMINPAGAIGAGKAIILPAFAAGKSLGQLKEADRLIDAGLSAQEVFTRTGIYQDPTGAGLRSVVSDQGSSLRMPYVQELPRILKYKDGRAEKALVAKLDTNSMLLSDLLTHPDPEVTKSLRGVTVRGNPGGFGGGEFNPNIREITLKTHKSAKDLQTTLLHEVQHIIQNDFSMPFGGNTEMFFKDKIGVEVAKSKLETLITDPDYISGLSDNAVRDLLGASKTLKLLDEEALSLYKRIPGEAEARAVEDLFTSGDALLPRVPTSYYDVPVDELLANPQYLPKLDERAGIKLLLDYINKLPAPTPK